mmetsp:Transcript_60093/g.172519  ORF Transcript_60093/g.172519 Transcript_60093/m.172519 type:complete len:176 (+) Transcript_60093:656-1183(+)
MDAIKKPCAPAQTRASQCVGSSARGQAALRGLCRSMKLPEPTMVPNAISAEDAANMAKGPDNATATADVLDGATVSGESPPSTPHCGEGRKMGGFQMAPRLRAARNRANCPTASRPPSGARGNAEPGMSMAPAAWDMSLAPKKAAQARQTARLRREMAIEVSSSVCTLGTMTKTS